MDDLSGLVISACIEVHRALGPGLLESAYEACLARELALRELPFQRQVPVPLDYKGERVDVGFRLDLLVDGHLIVELKADQGSLNLARAQVLTYLKITGLHLGLVVNFNHPRLVDGLTRVVLDLRDPA
ncbi:MAG TPA: GxxExxY protein [Holophagaceae bacterium]|nr:GxxExxY protein [Holophagaceae bacterium]